jgi:hypothetical protein
MTIKIQAAARLKAAENSLNDFLQKKHESISVPFDAKELEQCANTISDVLKN